jgi:hypothetical protein
MQTQTMPEAGLTPAMPYTPPALAGLAMLSIDDLFSLMEELATLAVTVIAAAPPELRQGLAVACTQSLLAKVERLDGDIVAAA